MRKHMGVAALTVAVGVAAPAAALADGYGGGPGGGDGGASGAPLRPGDLLVSGSVYREADIQPGVTQLPPGCAAPNCVTATADGAYPYVFDNDLVDGSFGITSPIVLDEITPAGRPVGRIRVPTDELVTSFSSKSELALNDSTSGRALTFMDYVAPDRALDVSNSNTPGVVDPTNPVPDSYYRTVARLSAHGRLSFVETNAYSGNNGRAAILDDRHGAGNVYTAGNAGNGASPQPDGVILGAGTQIIQSPFSPRLDQTPGAPTPVASFNVAQLGDPTDKVGKDDNFRGLTLYDNVLYYTKGSGGNGVNTVYFVDTTGTACPNGVGLPVPGAPLPSSPLAYDPSTLQSTGLPSNMCILRGFPTTLAKKTTDSFPFGVWFANPTTLYAADEGNGDTSYSAATNTYTGAAAQTTAGLQKWVFDPTDGPGGSWKLAYTLTAGLNLGQPYTVPGYPVGDNAATGLPWAPATEGLRNLTGRVNRNGSATIWAVTSTVSGSGDQGADPNQLVAITDDPSAAAPAAGEAFATIVAPRYAHVVRGVAFAPSAGDGWSGRGLSSPRRRARGGGARAGG